MLDPYHLPHLLPCCPLYSASILYSALISTCTSEKPHNIAASPYSPLPIPCLLLPVHFPPKLIGILGHKILVELLNLADIVLGTRAQGSDAQMVCPWFLAEPGAGDAADACCVCKSCQLCFFVALFVLVGTSSCDAGSECLKKGAPLEVRGLLESSRAGRAGIVRVPVPVKCGPHDIPICPHSG